ncbi:MAG: ATP-binding protein [Lachnospiraceae bacterium]|nr:ATP-binding protein [Lachnospiraceae bacterium]
MAVKAKLPTGIENFREMRTHEYYYVDKTGLIRDLLENFGKVNLFTRPRRFGKTLNISMLKYFFEVGSDGGLFDGLEISGEKELCDKNMGRFPVIFVSLKGVGARCFDEAKGMLRNIVGNEAMRFQFLLESGKLTQMERKRYEALINIDETGAFTMSDELLIDSLYTLSQLLQKHYGQNAVILIDEYDVPLQKADGFGYYEDMAAFIRSLFENAFKTNDSLYFAVLTGCLRISKESIFTGLNNLKVYTVKDVRYKEYFGFTDGEVRQMLAYYGFMDQYDAVREWYDGYVFGNLGIYCPWDVINYCGDLRDGSVTQPQNYWVNTSSNDIIRRLLGKANATTRNEIELLVNGSSIKKMLRQELTYRDIDSDPDNLWSILFTTGYLTQSGGQNGELTELVIPNREIQWIFVRQIREWFREESTQNAERLEAFRRAFEENEAGVIEKRLNEYLGKTISIRDTNVRKEMKENFYHGILLGILGNIDDWLVRSNAESGDGYSDISIEIREKGIGIVIELKYAENGAFEAGCREALEQIKDKRYGELLIKSGMKTVYCYGVACYRKQCRVASEVLL